MEICGSLTVTVATPTAEPGGHRSTSETGRATKSVIEHCSVASGSPTSPAAAGSASSWAAPTAGRPARDADLVHHQGGGELERVRAGLRGGRPVLRSYGASSYPSACTPNGVGAPLTVTGWVLDAAASAPPPSRSLRSDSVLTVPAGCSTFTWMVIDKTLIGIQDAGKGTLHMSQGRRWWGLVLSRAR